MHLALFEDDRVGHFWPLAATRAVYDLRLGIRTLLETTRDAFAPSSLHLHTRHYLAAVTEAEHGLPTNVLPEGADVLFVNGRYVAEAGDVLERLRRAAAPGEPGRVFVQGDTVVAAWVPGARIDLGRADALTRGHFAALPEETLDGARLLSRLWHLLDELAPALQRDVQARLAQRTRAPGVFGALALIHPGATLRRGATISTEDGPVFIDEGALVKENAVVRGPAYLGPHAQVNVGAAIEGSAVGTWCKVGGEVHGSVLHSYSSKVHAGYLGDSYLGRWCNLGAGTNNSNLKNDYGEVSLYDAHEGDFVPTGRQFAGLFMGDHSKCSINTMFNTGTVVGVFCNIFGSGFPPRHVPSFSWGGAETGFSDYRLEKALRVAEAVMARRNKSLTEAERAVLTKLAEEE